MAKRKTKKLNKVFMGVGLVSTGVHLLQAFNWTPVEMLSGLHPLVPRVVYGVVGVLGFGVPAFNWVKKQF